MIPTRPCLFRCLAQSHRLNISRTNPIGCQVYQSRAASSDASPKPESSKPEELNLNSDNRLPLLSILDTLGSGKRTKSRYDRAPSTSYQPQNAFPAIPRREAKDSGPFATYAGRTKTVENGDISAAFRALGTTLRVNSVQRDYRYQKFYEKPSNKRVRLNRERHRARFARGVKRLVMLVKEQRKYA